MSFTLTGTNLGAPDANALADFYRRLLGWTVAAEEPGRTTLQQRVEEVAEEGKEVGRSHRYTALGQGFHTIHSS